MKRNPEINDRFKFRVYSSRLKRYIEQSPCFGLLGQISDLHTLEKNHIIEQCTGLVDKFDTLIFEGDIIAFDGDNHKYTVMWHHGIAQFLGMCFSDISIASRPIFQCEHKSIEIIGNVHDNERQNKDV